MTVERGTDSSHALAMTRIRDCAAVLQKLAESPEYLNALTAAADAMTKCLRSGNKILFFGNGGSAGDSAARLSHVNSYKFLNLRYYHFSN